MKNIEKYQNLISKGEVDALLLTSKHNRQYAAEYCIAEGVAVICKTQSYYFTDFRYIESAQKNLPGFAVKMVDTEHPYTKLINEAISDNTVKTIGFEDDTLTVEEYTLYNTKLNAVLHPYAAEINAPRASKEPWEIEYMKKAQEITDRTFDDLLNVIHPGMTEKELAIRFDYLQLELGAQGNSFSTICASGENGSLPHAIPGNRKLRKGDMITLDVGCKVGGYCSDMTRTVALGEPSAEMRKVYNTVLEAQRLGREALAPGKSCYEIDKLVRDYIDSQGYVGRFGHGLGHGVGIDIHENPRLSMTCHDTVQVGHILTVEPGIYLPGVGGVRIEDTCLVTPEGNEPLTPATKELIIL